MTNPAKDAVPSSGNLSYSALRTALAEGMLLPLVNAAAVTAFNSQDNATDYTTYLGVHYAGSVYYYDSTDTTSAHDPAGGVIVDGSGRRYIRAQGVDVTRIVLDKDLTAPPGGESFGDAYYVATGATGDWSGQDGNYAIYSDRGWLFSDIAEGEILYVSDEQTFYHMPNSGTLTKGLGDLALADDSIELKHLESPLGVIVQAEQTTPPGSPSDRVKYIVAASATGDWSGQDTDVAEYDSTAAAWVFHSPAAGSIVWDVGAGYYKRFTGSAWTRAIPSAVLVQSQRNTNATNTQLGNSSQWYDIISNASDITAESTSNEIIARGFLFVNPNSSNDEDITIGVFVDSESSSRDEQAYHVGQQSNSSYRYWVPFVLNFNPSDTSAHTIKIRAKRGSSGVINVTGVYVEFEERVE